MKKKILILSLVVITGFGLLASTVKARTVKTKGKVDFTYPDTPAEWATAFNVLDQGMSAGKVALMFIGEPFIWQGLVSINPDIKIIAQNENGGYELYLVLAKDGRILSQVIPNESYPQSGDVLSGTASFFWFGQEVNDVLFEITMP